MGLKQPVHQQKQTTDYEPITTSKNLITKLIFIQFVRKSIQNKIINALKYSH